jgi:hypothetical protein
MARPIALIAGLIAIAVAVLSIFIETFGFFNVSITSTPLFGTPTTASMWYNSLWGYYDYGDDKIIYASEKSTEMAAGILMILGGVLCLLQKKTPALLGGILILAGLGLWTLVAADKFVEFIESFGASADDYTILDLFSGEESWNVIFFTLKLEWGIGYGYYGMAAAGVLGLVGSSAGSDK